MKVTRVSQILDIYSSNQTRKAERTGKSDRKDVFSLSKEGKDFQIALNALSQVPEIREEKVQDIKQRIQSGNYNINVQELADKIVESAFDKKI